MPLTIMLVDITPLERRLLTLSWTESANYLNNVLAFRDSLFSTPLVVALALVSPPC